MTSAAAVRAGRSAAAAPEAGGPRGTCPAARPVRGPWHGRARHDVSAAVRARWAGSRTVQPACRVVCRCRCLAPGVPARRVLLRRIADMYAVPLSDAAIDLLAAGPAGIESDRLDRAAVEPCDRAAWVTRRAWQSPPSTSTTFVSFLQDQAHERQPTFRLIAGKTAKYFSVTTQQLRGPSQRSQVVRARGVAMLLARNLTGKSLELIGEYFGHRDHTTVLHACRKTEPLRHTDPAISQAMDELCGTTEGATSRPCERQPRAGSGTVSDPGRK